MVLRGVAPMRGLQGIGHMICTLAVAALNSQLFPLGGHAATVIVFVVTGVEREVGYRCNVVKGSLDNDGARLDSQECRAIREGRSDHHPHDQLLWQKSTS